MVILQGNDGSVTASVEEMGIVVSASTEEEACLQLAKAIFEYSQEFCANYGQYSNMSGGHEQIPYVVKAVLLGCPENIIPEMVFRARERSCNSIPAISMPKTKNPL